MIIIKLLCENLAYNLRMMHILWIKDKNEQKQETSEDRAIDQLLDSRLLHSPATSSSQKRRQQEHNETVKPVESVSSSNPGGVSVRDG